MSLLFVKHIDVLILVFQVAIINSLVI